MRSRFKAPRGGEDEGDGMEYEEGGRRHQKLLDYTKLDCKGWMRDGKHEGTLARDLVDAHTSVVGNGHRGDVCKKGKERERDGDGDLEEERKRKRGQKRPG